ncbi:MAG: Tpl protein [Candidatus Cloacimonetes bacterium]|nr:Tpl protein [Candidatus Cloacimonadota bacterium]
MDKFIEVRFKYDRKELFTKPEDLKLYSGQHVIVEAEKGADIGRISTIDIESDKINVKNSIKKIIRPANNDDLRILARVRKKEIDAKKKFLEALKNQPFDMDLVDIEYQFDGNKLTFYFMSETRVDFRNFLRDLAGIFRTRIELRQINERQEIKRLGGFGPCGRELCCKSLNLNLNKATIQMAKHQNVTVSTSKISGLCGKLLCCLTYEEDFYLERAKEFPTLEDEIIYNNKTMKVTKNNYLVDTVELKDENHFGITISLDEYKSLKNKKGLRSTRKVSSSKSKRKK